MESVMNKTTSAVLLQDQFREYAIKFRKAYPNRDFPLRMSKEVSFLLFLYLISITQ